MPQIVIEYVGSDETNDGTDTLSNIQYLQFLNSKPKTIQKFIDEKALADGAAQKIIDDKIAADKALADAAAQKIIDDKIAADKALADAAAQKIIDDKIAADKALADVAAQKNH